MNRYNKIISEIDKEIIKHNNINTEEHYEMACEYYKAKLIIIMLRDRKKNKW